MTSLIKFSTVWLERQHVVFSPQYQDSIERLESTFKATYFGCEDGVGIFQIHGDVSVTIKYPLDKVCDINIDDINYDEDDMYQLHQSNMATILNYLANRRNEVGRYVSSMEPLLIVDNNPAVSTTFPMGTVSMSSEDVEHVSRIIKSKLFILKTFKRNQSIAFHGSLYANKCATSTYCANVIASASLSENVKFNDALRFSQVIGDLFGCMLKRDELNNLAILESSGNVLTYFFDDNKESNLLGFRMSPILFDSLMFTPDLASKIFTPNIIYSLLLCSLSREIIEVSKITVEHFAYFLPGNARELLANKYPGVTFNEIEKLFVKLGGSEDDIIHVKCALIACLHIQFVISLLVETHDCSNESLHKLDPLVVEYLEVAEQCVAPNSGLLLRIIDSSKFYNNIHRIAFLNSIANEMHCHLFRYLANFASAVSFAICHEHAQMQSHSNDAIISYNDNETLELKLQFHLFRFPGVRMNNNNNNISSNSNSNSNTNSANNSSPMKISDFQYNWVHESLTRYLSNEISMRRNRLRNADNGIVELENRQFFEKFDNDIKDMLNKCNESCNAYLEKPGLHASLISNRLLPLNSNARKDSMVAFNARNNCYVVKHCFAELSYDLANCAIQGNLFSISHTKENPNNAIDKFIDAACGEFMQKFQFSLISTSQNVFVDFQRNVQKVIEMLQFSDFDVFLCINSSITNNMIVGNTLQQNTIVAQINSLQLTNLFKFLKETEFVTIETQLLVNDLIKYLRYQCGDRVFNTNFENYIKPLTTFDNNYNNNNSNNNNGSVKINENTNGTQQQQQDAIVAMVQYTLQNYNMQLFRSFRVRTDIFISNENNQKIVINTKIFAFLRNFFEFVQFSIDENASLIQSKFRGHMAGQRYCAMKTGTLRLQSFIRMKSCRIYYMKIVRCAKTIKSLFRTRKERAELRRYRNAVNVIKKYYLNYILLKRRFTHTKQSIVLLHFLCKSYLLSSNLLTQRGKMQVINRNIMRYILRKRSIRRRQLSARLIQRAFRGSVIRKQYHKIIQQLKKSRKNRRFFRLIVKMQAVFRSHMIQRRFQDIKNSAIALQSVFRAKNEQRRYRTMQKVVLMIQTLYRRFRAQKAYHRMRTDLLLESEREKVLLLMQNEMRSLKSVASNQMKNVIVGIDFSRDQLRKVSRRVISFDVDINISDIYNQKWISTIVAFVAELQKTRKLVSNIICGEDFTIIQDNSNQLYGFGNGSDGQLGPNYIKRMISSFDAKIKELGDLNVISPIETVETVIASLDTTFQSISLSSSGSGATSSPMGASNSSFPLSSSLTPRFRIKQLCCGRSHVVLLSEAGRAYSWGENRRGQLGHSNFHATSMPRVVGVDVVVQGVKNGTKALGTSTSLMTSLAGLKNIVSISCGDFHTLFLLKSGILWITGAKECLGNHGDKEVRDASTPQQFSMFMKPKVHGAICGQHHVIIRIGSELFAFGRNQYGQLGIGSTENVVLSPQRVVFADPVLPVFKSVHWDQAKLFSGGRHHALLIDHNLYMWGCNKHSQISGGLPSEVTRATRINTIPTSNSRSKLLPHESNHIVEVSLGWKHSSVLTSLGHLYIWGTIRPMQDLTPENTNNGNDYVSSLIAKDSTVISEPTKIYYHDRITGVTSISNHTFSTIAVEAQDPLSPTSTSSTLSASSVSAMTSVLNSISLTNNNNNNNNNSNNNSNNNNNNNSNNNNGNQRLSSTLTSPKASATSAFTAISPKASFQNVLSPKKTALNDTRAVSNKNQEITKAFKQTLSTGILKSIKEPNEFSITNDSNTNSNNNNSNSFGPKTPINNNNNNNNNNNSSNKSATKRDEFQSKKSSPEESLLGLFSPRKSPTAEISISKNLFFLSSTSQTSSSSSSTTSTTTSTTTTPLSIPIPQRSLQQSHIASHQMYKSSNQRFSNNESGALSAGNKKPTF